MENGESYEEYSNAITGHAEEYLAPENHISTISFYNNDIDVDNNDAVKNSNDALRDGGYEHMVPAGILTDDTEHEKNVQDEDSEDIPENVDDNKDGYNESVTSATFEKEDHVRNQELSDSVMYGNEDGREDGQYQTESTVCEHSIENEHKYKKKKRRRREHRTKCDPESCQCPDERCKRRKVKRKKKHYLKRNSVDLGIENTNFVGERNSSEEIVQSSRSNGLWLGQELLDKSNIEYKQTRENEYLKQHEADFKTSHKHINGDISFQGQNLFLASKFSPRSENVLVRATKSKEHSNFIDTESGVGTYKKRSDIKKKRRLGDLKRTSSKVSIVHNVAPLSTRLELDPTARTARTQRDRNYLQDGSEALPEDFPDPLWFCEIITRFPVLSFLVITIIHLATVGTTAGLVFTGYDVFPVVFDGVPLYIYNDARLKELSWRSRWGFEDSIYRPVYGFSVNTGYRSQVKDTVEIIYEKPGVNILTRQHLEWIKKAEDQLFDQVDYKEDFCLLDHNYNCWKPQSLIRLFDGTYSHVDAVFNDKDFQNITHVLYKASIYNETRDFLDLFLSKDSVITAHNSYSSITRSFFVIGWPLSILRDGSWGTLQHVTDFLADTFKPKIENIRDFDLIERLDVYYLSKLLYEHDLIEQAMKDILLAIGSVIFIFVFMCFQTGSVVLTSLGIFSILSSFLLTNIFYRYVFQFKYFGFFHVISLFLILGIGADDLFVFYDTWRLTGHTKYPSDAHRMSECYRKAAKTTFVTSLTTMMAFLVSGLSPLLPVKTFGLFTGFLVAVNYIWVIIYFPSIIMIHHTKTKNLWRRFRRFLLTLYLTSDVLPETDNRSSSTTESNSVSETNSSRELLTKSKEKRKEHTDCFQPDTRANANSTYIDGVIPNRKQDVSISTDCFTEDTNQGNGVTNVNTDHDEHRRNYFQQKSMKPKKYFEDRNKIVKFLRNTFYDFMTKRIVKVLIPLMFLGVAIFFIHRATLIEPDTHQLRLFRSSHNYAKATERHFNSFRRNPDDEYQRLYMVWGILPADISGCDEKSADYCFGEPRYDNTIDMNTPTAQQAFKDLCSRLDNLDPDVISKLHIQTDRSTSKPKINCFTGAMERFYEETVGTNIPSQINISLPVDPDHVKTLMSANRYVFQQSVPNDFENYFEILVSYWLTNGYQLTPTTDYFSYNELLAERYVPGVTQSAFYYSSGIYYGGKMQFIAIEVNTTMNLYGLGYEEGLPIYNEWEQFMDSINDVMPVPFNNGIQVTENLWHWLHVQEILASSAVTGIMVGLLSVWPILVITTMNVIIGTLATVTIGLVTACVIGLIPLAGWKLGVLESINLCMVVGLSVDYIVHLAEAYRMSTSTRRLDRVHNMLESIGLSVISGAITTMGAALFMVFAQIQFFLQFGIFILSTVGISLLFSLLGFTTLLSLCGPENDTGSLPALIRRVADFCRRGKKSDSEEDPTQPSRCPCAPPSVLVDRFYEWLSNKTSKTPNSARKKPSLYR